MVALHLRTSFNFPVFRFDFTHMCAMTAAEVKQVEKFANEMIYRNQQIYAKEAPLAIAKTIQVQTTVHQYTCSVHLKTCIALDTCKPVNI